MSYTRVCRQQQHKMAAPTGPTCVTFGMTFWLHHRI